MIKVGIVGLGYMAATHLKAYRQLAGVRIGNLQSGRAVFEMAISPACSGILTWATDPVRLDMAFVKPATAFHADLLADPAIHLIDICAPTAAHPELAIAALQAGRHVLCEEPPVARTGRARGVSSWCCHGGSG